MKDCPPTLVAFVGTCLLARGPAAEVVLACKRRSVESSSLRLALYRDSDGRVLDIDLSGDEAAVLTRLATHPLLDAPVDGTGTGTRYRRPRTPARLAADAAYRFMHDLVGDIDGFEEASRALYAGNDESFRRETAHWPQDVRDQLDRFRAAAARETRSERRSSARGERQHAGALLEDPLKLG